MNRLTIYAGVSAAIILMTVAFANIMSSMIIEMFEIVGAVYPK